MTSRICSKAILSSRMARAHFSNLMYGVIPSRVKGPGFEYVDLREYSPGDDIRFIDWRASARMIKPDGEYRLMVKEYLFEKQVNNIVVLDYSGSMNYGDKIYTAIYVLTGFLSIAHSLGDLIDFIILYGDKPIVKHGVKPLEAINLALNTICKIDPRGSIDLVRLANYVKNYRNREALFLITDYAHNPLEFEVLAITSKAINTVLVITLITSPIEIMPPGINGYNVLIDLENDRDYGKLFIKDYYKLLRKHLLKVKGVLMKNRVPYAEIIGLRDAVYKRLRLLKLYSLTRMRIIG
jgi:uncharacterized protein (DUF58 family)